MSILIVLAAQAASPAAPPPPPLVAAPVASAELAPLALPEAGKVSLDFTVEEDGQATLCIIRPLGGRYAGQAAQPARCPASSFEPYRGADGKPVRKNVSIITTVTTEDRK